MDGAPAGIRSGDDEELAFAAFGYYVVPLQIGAPDMAFPRINMASFWVFFVGGVIMMASFFVTGGAAGAAG